MLNDYFFWFAQPSSVLNDFDWWSGYTAAAFVVVAVLILIVKLFIKHPVYNKALNRFRNLFLTMGVIALVWFGFRYETTPIFSKRMWLAMIVLATLVWFGFILKYLFLNFNAEKSEYEANLLNSKYMPKRKGK